MGRLMRPSRREETKYSHFWRRRVRDEQEKEMRADDPIVPKLDPKPYRQMLGDSREESRETAPNTHAYVFDPRWGYSQNLEDYS